MEMTDEDEDDEGRCLRMATDVRTIVGVRTACFNGDF